MRLSAKITLSVVLIVSLAVAVSGYAIVSSVFNAQLTHQITAAAEETQLLCSVLGTMAVERRTGTGAEVTERALEETLQISPFRDYSLRLTHPMEPRETLEYEIVKAPEGAQDVYELVVTCRFSVDQSRYYLENRRDVSDLYRLRGQYLATFRLVYLAAAAFSIVAGIALGAVLTAPIRNLSRSARQIAAGNYSVRANVHTADEIGILATQFNHMTQELEEHIQSLELATQQQKDFTAAHYQALETLCRTGGTLSLPGGAQAVCRGGVLTLTLPDPAPDETPLRMGGNSAGPWYITLSAAPLPGALALREGRYTVRRWHRDDRFTLPGSRGARSLKRLFADRGIPPEQRDAVPVLCRDGIAAAVPGVGIDQLSLPGEPGHTIYITVKMKDNGGTITYG